MPCLTVEQERIRNRFFHRRCPIREVEQTVFHGTPLSGMVDILRTGKLIPQGHAELPTDDWLSVSVNDNVLNLFSDGEKGATGFASTPRLRVRHLDNFHCLAATARVGLIDEDEQGVSYANRLGYVNRRGEVEMDEYELRHLIDTCHGLAFPSLKWCKWMGFHFDQWNEVAEIALNEEGCRAVWQAMDIIFVDGKEYEDLSEGWSAVLKLALSRGIISSQEEFNQLQNLT